MSVDDPRNRSKMNDASQVPEQGFKVCLVADIFPRIDLFVPDVDLLDAGIHSPQQFAQRSADKAARPRDKDRLIPHFGSYPQSVRL